MKTEKFVVKSVERTVFGSAGHEARGAILTLAEPIPQVIGSLEILVPNTEQHGLVKDMTSKRIPLIMTNVTELHVTDEVMRSGTVTVEDIGDGTITVELLHLDVSKPHFSEGKLVRPPRVWIVDKTFKERLRHISSKEQNDKVLDVVKDVNDNFINNKNA